MSTLWRRIGAALLSVVILAAVLVLMIGGTLRLTVFDSSWYQQAFSADAYARGLRAGIEDDLAEQGAYVGIPAEVLSRGISDEQVYVVLRAHYQNLADFLNKRAALRQPAYPVELFREPLMAYAREQSLRGGLTLTAEQERLLEEIARDSAAIVQRRVAVVDLTTAQNSSLFHSIHRILYLLAQLPQVAVFVLLLALVLLDLIHRPVRRALVPALIGIWTASALLAVPLMVQEWFDLVRRLSVAPDYLKFALDRLLTSATRGLLTWSVAVMLLSGGLLVALFFIEERLADREARRQRQLSRRRRRQDPDESLAASDR